MSGQSRPDNNNNVVFIKHASNVPAITSITDISLDCWGQTLVTGPLTLASLLELSTNLREVHSVLIDLLVGALNNEKALIGAFSGHCETSRRFVDSSSLDINCYVM